MMWKFGSDLSAHRHADRLVCVITEYFMLREFFCAKIHACIYKLNSDP